MSEAGKTNLHYYLMNKNPAESHKPKRDELFIPIIATCIVNTGDAEYNTHSIFIVGLKCCMDQLDYRVPNEIEKDKLYVFNLEDLLPRHEILVNASIPILSLLRKEDEGKISIITQRILTDTELRVLLPLLASPSSCPQEVLQASYHCTYDILLQSIFPTDSNALLEWNELVQEYRQSLYEARLHKVKRAEMRGVYNALYGLRQKLEQLGLTIHSRKSEYYLSLVANK